MAQFKNQISPIFSRQVLARLGRYLLVGGFNTVLSLSLMTLGAFMGLQYLVYTAVGYTITILLSFFLNLRYTFQRKDRLGMRLMGFLLVSFSNLAIVELIEYYLVDWCAMQRPVAILLGMLWYVISGFLLNNFVVYRHFSTDNKPESIR